MADTRLAQCLRCKAFTLLNTSGPVHWACNIAPADSVTYVSALTQRLALYGVVKTAGGSLKARAVSPGVVVPAWSPTGAQEGVERLHVEHPCPVKDQRPVKPVGPPVAPPATPGAPAGGSRPLAAHVYGPPAPARPSRAGTANHPRSDSYPICGTCGRNVKSGEIFTGLQHGPKWIWAEHDRCQ